MSGRNLTYGKGRTGGGVVFFLFLLGVVLTLGLYFVKTRAQTAKSEARTLQRTLDAEQLVVSTLKAELAHLESPARLEQLASDQLGLAPTSVEQIKTLDELTEALPDQKSADAEIIP